MSRRRRRPEEPPHHPGKQLTLNEIKFATCETLEFPYDLCCVFCKPKRSILENTRKPRKTFRAKLGKNRCDQFWDERWVNYEKATTGQIKKHIETRNYLQINVETTLEEIGYENTHRRRKLPSSVSHAPLDDGVLMSTVTVESAGTSSHTSTALDEGSEPVGSRAFVPGVVEIEDFTTSAALCQPLSAPPVNGVLTAKDVFESSAGPSGHSNTPAEGSDALLLLANCAGGGVNIFSGNSAEQRNTLRAPRGGSVLRVNQVIKNIGTSSVLSTVLAEGSDTLGIVENNVELQLDLTVMMY